MKKESFISKLADRLIRSGKFGSAYEKAWDTHAKMFGPIMEPAFVENSSARIKLVAALNQLSRKELSPALKGLTALRKNCASSADHAAILYFVGLAYEFSGDAAQSRQYYIEAAEYGHRFYLPYMKIAKDAHKEAVFETAEENYRKALDCLDEKAFEADERLRLIAASAHSNLASCLTMMHRYDEAEEQLSAAERILPVHPERSSAAAILYAAMGQPDRVKEHVAVLAQHAPQLLPSTQALTGSILQGRHPQFSALPPERSLIAPFWQWFSEGEERFIRMLRNKEYAEPLDSLTERLKPIFPFMQRELECGMMMDPACEAFTVDLPDFFSVALQKGYEELIAACPEGLKARWTFRIIH